MAACGACHMMKSEYDMDTIVNTINILLTTDERYAQHCAVCIRSIIDNNADVKLNILVAGISLFKETIDKLESFNSKYIYYVKVIEFDKQKLNEFPEIGGYSRDVYVRLWVEEFFPDADKVIYLDVDTIVVDSLMPLWKINMGESILAAVDIPDATSHDRCHLPLQYGYFNSGVMLFNIVKWRDQQCRAIILDFLLKNSNIAFCPDQDALNGCFYKDRLVLDYQWNLISPFFRKPGFPSVNGSKLKEIQKNAKIIHFNGGGGRPWLYTSLHPYKVKYLYYLSKTPFSTFVPSDKTFTDIVKKYIRQMFYLDDFITINELELKGR